MKIATKHHGVREFNEDEIIVFNKGIPGFESLKRFIMFPVEENDVFSILHSIDDEALGFIIISPFSVVDSYEVDLDEAIIERLLVKEPMDIQLASTVTISSKIEEITVNLKAPFVINIKERLGEQVILDKSEYLIKHPLLKG